MAVCAKTDLAKNGDALEEAEEDADPSYGERDDELPPQAAQVVDTVGQLQHVTPATPNTPTLSSEL